MAQQEFHLFLLGLAILMMAGPSAAALVDHFSDTYQEADESFRQTCASMEGATLREYVHKGLGGFLDETLSTRVCTFGPENAATVLFAISGVHGAEMFAPAAVQLQIMTDTSSNPPGRYALPDNVRAVIVHGLEPWGASWGFKENEDNIDTLKNLNGFYELSYNDTLLRSFIDDLDIAHLNDPAVQAQAQAVFQDYSEIYGSAFFFALARGQWSREIGIAFYGTAETWSRRVLRDVVDRYLDRSVVKHVLLLDLHSAAGDFGDWLVAAYDSASQDALFRWVNQSGIDKAIEPIESAGVSTDPYPYYQFIVDQLGDKLVYRVLWEAGTYPQDEYQQALTLGVHCRYYEDLRGDYCQSIISQIRTYFYPNLPEWKASLQTRLPDTFDLVKYGLEEMAALTSSSVLFSPSLLLVSFITCIILSEI